eukprot:scaffold8926_cov17-Tisochrysis_lutea.AAC.1
MAPSANVHVHSTGIGHPGSRACRHVSAHASQPGPGRSFSTTHDHSMLASATALHPACASNCSGCCCCCCRRCRRRCCCCGAGTEAAPPYPVLAASQLAVAVAGRLAGYGGGGPALDAGALTAAATAAATVAADIAAAVPARRMATPTATPLPAGAYLTATDAGLLVERWGGVLTAAAAATTAAATA